MQRGKTQFVAAQRAKQRFPFQRSDESLSARDDSRLRAAEQFIAAEANKIGASLQRFGRASVRVRQFPTDSVANMAPLPRSSTNGIRFFRASALISFERGRFDKTAHEEITAVHFENHRGLWSDGVRIIIERRFVGCADFAQFRAARFEDFADAKSAADLHQFAA